MNEQKIKHITGIKKGYNSLIWTMLGEAENLGSLAALVQWNSLFSTLLQPSAICITKLSLVCLAVLPTKGTMNQGRRLGITRVLWKYAVQGCCSTVGSGGWWLRWWLWWWWWRFLGELHERLRHRRDNLALCLTKIPTGYTSKQSI